MRSICTSCLSYLHFSFKNHITRDINRRFPSIHQQPRSNQVRIKTRPYSTSPDPPSDFTSLADAPPRLVKSGRRHGPGLIILALIPITAFALGTWQVFRLDWKTSLIAKFEDRLIRDPLPLPTTVDPTAIKDFDYRRIEVRGRWRHDLEMLIGPRMREGKNGYLVVTPLERDDGRGGVTRVLVCRGWIGKEFAAQRKRNAAGALPVGEVVVEGLLREAWKRNMFTPVNKPDQGEWYFPDVAEMARHSSSQEVWVEETMQPDLVEAFDREEKGIPIGRPAEVNLRNNHAQYIFTWYSLSAATSIMLWMVIRKPPSRLSTKVRQSREWV